MLQEAIKNIQNVDKNKTRWVIAYSGGVDSCVLADLIFKNKPENVSLHLLHVNHGLGQKEAILWEDQARETAKMMNAEFITKRLNIDESGTGLEEKARNLRHGFIKENVDSNTVVFMGHHKNDQIETVLFRFFRGTGIKGMSGISLSRGIGEGELYRPLLSVTRQEIEHYARSNGMSWFEDDTNIDQNFSRNFLRHNVIPLVKTRWSHVIENIVRFSEKADESYRLNMEIAEEDYQKSLVFMKNGKIGVSYDKVDHLSDLRKKNLVSYIIEEKAKCSIESKNFNNAMSVIFSEKRAVSKHRKIVLKNHEIICSANYFWIESK